MTPRQSSPTEWAGPGRRMSVPAFKCQPGPLRGAGTDMRRPGPPHSLGDDCGGVMALGTVAQGIAVPGDQPWPAANRFELKLFRQPTAATASVHDEPRAKRPLVGRHADHTSTQTQWPQYTAGLQD